MDLTVDGERCKTINQWAGPTRVNIFFGKDPEMARLVDHLTDEDIVKLNRGGHETPTRSMRLITKRWPHKGQPTVILAHTVKGYGFGDQGEAQNTNPSAEKALISKR